MSIGPIGVQQELDAEQRRVYHERKAAAAAGVGQPDGEDHEAAERDANGRRPWEDRPQQEDGVASPDAPPAEETPRPSGNLLDLTG
jgi:hypothetical protein